MRHTWFTNSNRVFFLCMACVPPPHYSPSHYMDDHVLISSSKNTYCTPTQRPVSAKKKKKSLISISCPQTENMQSLYCPHWGCTHTHTHRQDTMSSSVWPIPVVLLAKFNQALLSLSPRLAWWRQTRPSGLLLSKKITTTVLSLHPLT